MDHKQLLKNWAAPTRRAARRLARQRRRGKAGAARGGDQRRSEEHTSELQSLMRNSYAVFCLQKKNTHNAYKHINITTENYRSSMTHHKANSTSQTTCTR